MDLDDNTNSNTINNEPKDVAENHPTDANANANPHTHAAQDIVRLRHLASEAVHSTYADLQSLLNNRLPAANNDQRRQLIFDFVVKARLLLARLLGATRWAATYANAAANANTVEHISTDRINTLDYIADDLWAARERVLLNAAPPVHVRESLNLFNHANRTTNRSANASNPHIYNSVIFPQVVRTAAGISTHADMDIDPPDADDNDVVMEGATSPTTASALPHQLSPHARISLATRRALRDALPAVPRVKVLDWNAPPACVRVGIPHLWSADLMLDALDINAPYGLNGKSANFRCYRIALLLNADPDAPTSVTATPNSASDANSPNNGNGSDNNNVGNTDNNGSDITSAVPAGLTIKEESMLCRLADDRMAHAAAAAAALSLSTSSDGSPNSATAGASHPKLDRAQVMLGALCDLLTSEVCAPLVMGHLRSQAEALKNGPWSQALQITGSAVDSTRNTPIVLKYWNSYRTPASITISEYQPKTSTAINDSHTQLVVVTHEPPLPPGCAGNHNFPALIEENTQHLNLESILLSCVRIRSGERLLRITEAVLRRRIELAVHSKCLTLRTSCRENEHRIRPLGTNINFSQVGYESLVIHLHQDRCLGIEVRINPKNGGLRVRTFGAANLVVPSKKEPNGNAWKGDRFIASSEEEDRIVCTIVKTVRGCVKLDCAARAVCALDIGVSNTLPPGTASVAATAPAERSASQLVPPFAPLERRSPRRFLTLSPPPNTTEQVKGVANSFVTALPAETRNCLSREGPYSKRPRLTYATTSDALVFIQESSVMDDDRCPLDKAEKTAKRRRYGDKMRPSASDMDDVDRYNGTAAAAAAWAVTRDVVERRLRRDSLLRAFVAANVASAAHTHHMKSGDDGALHLESASRVLLKVKCEPLPVRRAELLLRGSDAWQVRLSLLPPIFDSTDAALGRDNANVIPNGVPSNNNNTAIAKNGRKRNQARDAGGGDGNLWTVGVACGGSQLTFTYPSANAASVRSFFRDLTRARTAAALARGVPPSPFYRVLRRSPVRIVVGVGPFHSQKKMEGKSEMANGITISGGDKGGNSKKGNQTHTKHSYTATVEYVYSEGNSGGFSLKFKPTKPTMELLAPLIEEALDASGGQVGGILAGLLERACPVAAAAESAVRERGHGRIRFVTALRVRAVFAGVEQGSGINNNGNNENGIIGNAKDTKDKGKGNNANNNNSNADNKGNQNTKNRPPPGQVPHAVDVDARGGGGVVTVIDVGRATSVMIQQGFANRGGSTNNSNNNDNGRSSSSGRRDFVLVPKWDDIVAQFCRDGHAEAQRAGSTVVLRMSELERFLTALVESVRPRGTSNNNNNNNNANSTNGTTGANGPTNNNNNNSNTNRAGVNINNNMQNAAANSGAAGTGSGTGGNNNNMGTPQSIMANNGNGVSNVNNNNNNNNGSSNGSRAAANLMAATVEPASNNVATNNNNNNAPAVAAAMTANATTT